MRRGLRVVCLVGLCVPLVVKVVDAVPTKEQPEIGDGDPVVADLRDMGLRMDRLEAALGLARGAAASGGLRDRYEALREREVLIAQAADEALRFVPSGSPVRHGVITSAYSASRVHPVLNRVRAHHGLDIAADRGSPVSAMAAGRVRAFRSPEYGVGIDILHGDSKYVTRYAHLESAAVKTGEEVEKGEVIGYIGKSGLVTAPSLHFEVYFEGRARDPMQFLDGELSGLTVEE